MHPPPERFKIKKDFNKFYMDNFLFNENEKLRQQTKACYIVKKGFYWEAIVNLEKAKGKILSAKKHMKLTKH